jgi:hypothetical protein
VLGRDARPTLTNGPFVAVVFLALGHFRHARGCLRETVKG